MVVLNGVNQGVECTNEKGIWSISVSRSMDNAAAALLMLSCKEIEIVAEYTIKDNMFLLLHCI